jgi:hypothetical protein
MFKVIHLINMLLRSEEEIRNMLQEHKAKLEKVLDPSAHLRGVTDVRWLQGRVEMLEWVLSGDSNAN